MIIFNYNINIEKIEPAPTTLDTSECIQETQTQTQTQTGRQ